MLTISNYLSIAIENEIIFKNILRDMRNHRELRPMGIFIPHDLDSESSINEIFQKYSTGRRHGKFTICNFIINNGIAILSYRDVAPLSGGGSVYKYKVNDDKTVTFLKPMMTMMS